MANPYRLLSGGLLAAFSVALGAAFLQQPKAEPPAPPPRPVTPLGSEMELMRQIEEEEAPALSILKRL